MLDPTDGKIVIGSEDALRVARFDFGGCRIAHVETEEDPLFLPGVRSFKLIDFVLDMKSFGMETGIEWMKGLIEFYFDR